MVTQVSWKFQLQDVQWLVEKLQAEAQHPTACNEAGDVCEETVKATLCFCPPSELPRVLIYNYCNTSCQPLSLLDTGGATDIIKHYPVISWHTNMLFTLECKIAYSYWVITYMCCFANMRVIILKVSYHCGSMYN